MPVIYNKKVEYAYTDPGVKAHTLSWAEYKALSEDDKMNGDLYFIPDKQPEGNPSRIWTKLGTDPLTTQADDVSGAVNELNSSLTNFKTYTEIGIVRSSSPTLTFSKTAYSVILLYVTSGSNTVYTNLIPLESQYALSSGQSFVINGANNVTFTFTVSISGDNITFTHSASSSSNVVLRVLGY